MSKGPTGAERAKELGEKPIGRLILTFSVPAVVGMMVNALYNVVDRIFIGRGVGHEAIAGVYLTFPLALVTLAVGMLVGIGGNALSSIRLGEGKREESQEIFQNSYALILFLSILLALFFALTKVPLLQLVGASESLMPYALDYLRVILWGLPFQLVGYALNNFIRGEGNPGIAMLTMVIGALVNILLDYLFIIRLGWGVTGAAWATVIGQFVSMVWVLRYFTRGNSLLRLNLTNLSLSGKRIKEIVMLGLSPCAMQLGSALINALFNRSVATYGGDTGTATLGIISSLGALIFMPLFGINQGCQPILGYNYGAGNLSRVKKTLVIAVTIGTIYILLPWGFTRMGQELIVRLFIGREKEVLALLPMARTAITIDFLFLPVVAFQVIATMYFQATGKPKTGLFLSLSRQFIFLVPLLLFLPSRYGLLGIWWVSPLADLCSALVTAVFLWYNLKTMSRKPMRNKP